MNDWTLLEGDARRVLPFLEPKSAQAAITSPPYLWTREYGHPDEIGCEDTLEEYIAHLVKVFMGVHRVLADDGLLWIVISDTYARRAGGGADTTIDGGESLKIGRKNTLHSNSRSGLHSYRKVSSAVPRRRKMPPGCKQGDLIGVPWVLAFALRSAGWYWRQDIVWHKPDGMPEPVRSRCARVHENVLVFSKKERGYYHDFEAIMEPAKSNGNGFKRPTRANAEDREWKPAELRRKRSVWAYSTSKGRKKDSQTGTYPPGLIEPMVLASAPPGGTVLDPFAGSATTGEVAIRLGRRFIGIELVDENATKARGYLEEAKP